MAGKPYIGVELKKVTDTVNEGNRYGAVKEVVNVLRVHLSGKKKLRERHVD